MCSTDPWKTSGLGMPIAESSGKFNYNLKLYASLGIFNCYWPKALWTTKTVCEQVLCLLCALKTMRRLWEIAFLLWHTVSWEKNSSCEGSLCHGVFSVDAHTCCLCNSNRKRQKWSHHTVHPVVSFMIDGYIWTSVSFFDFDSTCLSIGGLWWLFLVVNMAD